MADSSFNWKNYIRVSDRFKENKGLVEKALNDIAATGKDGEELIEMIYANCKGPITIEPDTSKLFGSSAAPMFDANNLLLNLDQIKKVTVNTPQGPQHLSLTGVIVHEMFHLADFNVSKAVLAYIDQHKMLVSDHLTPDQRKSVTKAAYTYYLEHVDSLMHNDSTLSRDQARDIVDKEFQNDSQQLLTKLADLAKVPKGSFTYPLLTDPQFYEKLRAEHYVMAMDRCPAREQDATHYTDVFMAKHFPAEPWRGDYDNAQLGEEKPLFTQAPGCGVFKPGIYVAQEAEMGELGRLHQPRISATPNPGCPVPVVSR
ncbi:hypothetical protein [Mucilaginibacter paludis]|uniref:Uncharacterized protein n=1 Tax=Mucilaginibacter paludis DSM 18603 TaxID=714943 RepID=H1Y3M0_9SPHI|nr:hypothetical protein [Mucilaginibacter paludis]EHQ29788.1 hypothetical protein Mucpa_5720 [Mucilaginibacter paludis DSM 18603]